LETSEEANAVVVLATTVIGALLPHPEMNIENNNAAISHMLFCIKNTSYNRL
jgi:hypothetical protein